MLHVSSAGGEGKIWNGITFIFPNATRNFKCNNPICRDAIIITVRNAMRFYANEAINFALNWNIFNAALGLKYLI